MSCDMDEVCSRQATAFERFMFVCPKDPKILGGFPSLWDTCSPSKNKRKNGRQRREVRRAFVRVCGIHTTTSLCLFVYPARLTPNAKGGPKDLSSWIHNERRVLMSDRL